MTAGSPLRLAAAAVALAAVVACGEGSPSAGQSDANGRSAATLREQLGHTLLTEADAGTPIEIERFIYDIGLPDRKGLEVQLSGDSAATLRWRFVEKPDPLVIEWFAVDGQPAFETDGLIGDPSRAAKLLEFHGGSAGTGTLVFELVERDPAKRTGPPAKRLEFPFEVIYQETPVIHETCPLCDRL